MRFVLDIVSFSTGQENSQQLPNAIDDSVNDGGWPINLPTSMNHRLVPMAFFSSSNVLFLFNICCRIWWSEEQQEKHACFPQFKHFMSPWGYVVAWVLTDFVRAPHCCTLKGLHNTQRSGWISVSSLYTKITNKVVSSLINKYAPWKGGNEHFLRGSMKKKVATLILTFRGVPQMLHRPLCNNFSHRPVRTH